MVIKTRYWDPDKRYELDGRRENQVLLSMDEAWWANEDDWDVPVYLPEETLTAGETDHLSSCSISPWTTRF